MTTLKFQFQLSVLFYARISRNTLQWNLRVCMSMLYLDTISRVNRVFRRVEGMNMKRKLEEDINLF